MICSWQFNLEIGGHISHSPLAQTLYKTDLEALQQYLILFNTEL